MLKHNCSVLDPKESTKDETKEDAMAVEARRKGGRWRNGALVLSTLSS